MSWMIELAGWIAFVAVVAVVFLSVGFFLL